VGCRPVRSTLFALALLGPQFALASDIPAVTFGRDVLPHRRHRFAGNDAGADRGLDRHLKHVPIDFALQLFRDSPSTPVGIISVADEA
jgi:hypothetical protein